MRTMPPALTPNAVPTATVIAAVTTIGVGQTIDVASDTDVIVLQATAGNIIYTICNATITTVPTATLGLVLYSGSQEVLLEMVPGLVVKVLNASAGATVQLQQFRYFGKNTSV